MAAATVASNRTPSPHSSAGSPPQSQTGQLPPQPNGPLFTQQDVVRFVQAALAAAMHNQTAQSEARTQQSQLNREERIMKPRVHMYESYGERRTMVATLELPGLQKDDVSITARPNGDLLIAGERRPQHLQFLRNLRERGSDDEDNFEDEIEENGRIVFNEFKFGRFQRVLRLPNGTDPTAITASMDDGMLTICWPLPSLPSEAEHLVKQEHSTSDDINMDDANMKAATLRST